MSIRRVDTILFLAALVVMVVQAFIGWPRWGVVVFAALISGAVLAPSSWKVDNK